MSLGRKTISTTGALLASFACRAAAQNNSTTPNSNTENHSSDWGKWFILAVCLTALVGAHGYGIYRAYQRRQESKRQLEEAKRNLAQGEMDLRSLQISIAREIEKNQQPKTNAEPIESTPTSKSAVDESIQSLDDSNKTPSVRP